MLRITPFIKILLFSIFILHFSACSNSNTNSSGFRGADPQDLDPNNFGRCSQDPNVGENLQLSSFDSNIKDSGYYQKRLPLSQLEQSLQASPKSITQVLRKQGVSLFRVVVNQEASCQFYSFLSKPTKSAHQKWTEFSKPDTQKSVLLGLFTTFYERRISNGVVTLKQPTITLRHDTQKWTLLHEMTHYLFAKGRATKINMPFSTELLKQIDNTSATIKDLTSLFESQKKEDTAFNIINSYKKLYQLNVQLHSRGPLEEFTIEAMLFDRLNQISHINQSHDLNNAFRYMIENVRVMLPVYNTLLNKLKILRTRSFTDLPESYTNEVKKLEDSINDLINSWSEKLDSLTNRIYQANSRSTSVTTPLNQDSPNIQVHHYDQKIDLEQQRIITDL